MVAAVHHGWRGRHGVRVAENPGARLHKSLHRRICLHESLLSLHAAIPVRASWLALAKPLRIGLDKIIRLGGVEMLVLLASSVHGSIVRPLVPFVLLPPSSFLAVVDGHLIPRQVK